MNYLNFNGEQYLSIKDIYMNLCVSRNSIIKKIERLEKEGYNFLDRIKDEYEDKRILIVAHGGISIPVYCYFNGIPNDDNLLKLVLENCEIAKYEYK